jgi:hypothetical protein
MPHNRNSEDSTQISDSHSNCLKTFIRTFSSITIGSFAGDSRKTATNLNHILPVTISHHFGRRPPHKALFAEQLGNPGALKDLEDDASNIWPAREFRVMFLNLSRKPMRMFRFNKSQWTESLALVVLADVPLGNAKS